MSFVRRRRHELTPAHTRGEFQRYLNAYLRDERLGTAASGRLALIRLRAIQAPCSPAASCCAGSRPPSAPPPSTSSPPISPPEAGPCGRSCRESLHPERRTEGRPARSGPRPRPRDMPPRRPGALYDRLTRRGARG